VSALLTSETLGLLAGSAAGGWLYQDVGAGTPFVLEAGCLLAASLVLLRARALEGAREPAVAGAPERHALGAVLRIPGVALMGATSAVLMAVQTGVMVFLFPLYLVSHGGLGPGMVGVLVSLTVLGRLGALWLGGGASDRWGRMRVLWPALVAYAVVLAGLTLATHPVALGAAGVAAGGAAGLAMPLPAADIGDRVPPHLRAVAIGWLRTMTDTGHILGPLAMGWVADTAGAGGPFVLAAAALLVVGWRCRRRQGAGAT
jgi:MFS family permease